MVLSLVSAGCGGLHIHATMGYMHRSMPNQRKVKDLFQIQVASRELRMPLSSIHLRGTSTETIPNTNPSGGSVVADLNGLAVKVKIIAMGPRS